MTSADLNQDGYDDLVAGAPGYSQPGHIQIGRVYIVYGNKSGLPHVNLDLDLEADGMLEGSKVGNQVNHMCFCFNKSPAPFNFFVAMVPLTQFLKKVMINIIISLKIKVHHNAQPLFKSNKNAFLRAVCGNFSIQ